MATIHLDSKKNSLDRNLTVMDYLFIIFFTEYGAQCLSEDIEWQIKVKKKKLTLNQSQDCRRV